MSRKNELLKEYRVRRNFTRSPEPRGKKCKKSRTPIFVIQKHTARSLHYDFRIEISGVLKSWAVPKGPSTNPSIKRLAIPTDDHPIEYAKFEGVIPKGNYGAGTVMIWDYGSFKNIKKSKGKVKSLEQSYKDGQIEVWLKGKKLRGGYVLIRIGTADSKRWLLKKMQDEEADARRNPVKSQTKSAQTGRTMKQITKQEGE